MQQAALDFTVSAPFQGVTPASRHASWTGARSVVETWPARVSAYLQVIEAAGALNDFEAAALLHWHVSSVNSVRGWLRKTRPGLLVTDGHDDAGGQARVTRRTRWRLARVA